MVVTTRALVDPTGPTALNVWKTLLIVMTKSLTFLKTSFGSPAD